MLCNSLGHRLDHYSIDSPRQWGAPLKAARRVRDEQGNVKVEGLGQGKVSFLNAASDQITRRFHHLAIAAVHIPTALLDGIATTALMPVAAFFATLNMLTLNSCKPLVKTGNAIYSQMLNFGSGVTLTLPSIFKHCLGVLNPSAKVPNHRLNIFRFTFIQPDSSSFAKHTLGRIEVIFNLVSIVIQKLAIGITATLIGVPLSLITFGTSRTVNKYTSAGLKSLNSIPMTFFNSTIEILNPNVSFRTPSFRHNRK